jgi:hypothetical protein
MKMVEGFCGERLSDVGVTTWRQIDVLAVPGLLFVQSFLQEQLNRTAKVLLQRAIMLGGHHRCVDRLREVVLHDLFPGRLILSLEGVLKLLEGGCPVKMDFLGPLVEIGMVLSTVNLTPNRPLSMWISAFNLSKRGSLFCILYTSFGRFFSSKDFSRRASGGFLKIDTIFFEAISPFGNRNGRFWLP